MEAIAFIASATMPQSPFYEVVTVAGLPFAKFDCLLQGEVEWLEIEPTKQLKAAKPIANLASRIAEERDITVEASAELLDGALRGESNTLLIPYLDDIEAMVQRVQEMTEAVKRRDRVTMFIQSRVDQDWLWENKETVEGLFFRLKLDGEETMVWTDACTKRLPDRAMNEILEFFYQETEAGNKLIAGDKQTQLDDTATEDTGLDLGKSKRGFGNSKKAGRTGEKSTPRSSARASRTPSSTGGTGTVAQAG